MTVSADQTAGGTTLAVSGTGTGTRVIGLSGNLAFGNVAVGSSGQATLTIANTGNSTLTVSGISYPSGFSGAWSGTVAAGGSQPVTVTFSPTAATTYGGNLTVSADQTAGGTTLAVSGTGNFAAVNDNFANRIALSGMVVSTTGCNSNACKESGEPNHAGATGGKSVWWSWVAPTTGTVTISTVGSTFDTVLGLYTGTAVSSLTTIASNDDGNGSGMTSLLSASVVAGTEYGIAVDGYGGACGSIDLSISLVSPPTAPSIALSRVGNQLVLSWGTNWTGYILQSAKTLSAGATWDQVSPSPVVVGTVNMVTNTMSRSALFYRLQHP